MPHPAPAPTAPRKSFWRWPVRIFLTLAVLAAAAWFAGPPILSHYARPRIEQAVAEQVNGRAEIGSLSVTWGGSVSMKNLKIVPPGDAAVLEIPSLEAQVDVRDALEGRYIAKATLEKPVLRVRREPDGRTNLDHLMEKKGPPKPATAPAAQPLPSLRLDLVVRDATVLFEDGPEQTRLDDVDFTVDLPALDQAGRIESSFAIAGGGSGKLIARVTLAREGKIDPSGSVEYALDAPALEKLQTAARLFSDVEKLSGSVMARGSYTSGRLPELNGSDEWTLKGLVLAGEALGKEPVSFPEIRLLNKVAIDAKRVGKADLTLVSGTAIDALATVTFGEGEAVDAVFKLKSDLQALGQALRGLLRMKEGVSIDGALAADGTLKATGSKGTLKAKLLVDDLAALDAAGKKTPIEKKVALDCDLSFDGGAKSADIHTFTVDSSPVKATAKGTVGKDAISGTYTAVADLDLLARRLESFMDLGGTSLAGRLEADGEATSQGQDVRIKSRTIAKDLLVGNAGPINLESHVDASVRLGDAVLIDGAQRTTVSEFTYAGRKIQNFLVEARYKQVGEKIELLTLTAPGLKLDGAGTTARLAGTVDVDPGPFYRNVGVLFGEFGIDGQPMKGEFTVAGGETREVKLTLNGPEMVLGGKTHRDLALEFDAALGETVEIRRCHAATSMLVADAAGGIRDGKTDLEVTVTGDLGSLAVLAAMPPHWQVEGKASVKGTIAGVKDVYTLALDTSVPELEVTRKWRSDNTESTAATAKPVTIASRGTLTIGKEIVLKLKNHAEVVEVVREGRTVRNLALDCTLEQTGDHIDSFLVTGPGLKIDGSGPFKRFRARTEIDPGPFYKECAFLFGEFDMTGKPLVGDVAVTIDSSWDIQGSLKSPELSFSGRTYRDVEVVYDFGLTEEILIRKVFVGVAGGSLELAGQMGKTREAFEFSGEGAIVELAGPEVLPEGWQVPGKITVSGTATGANDRYDASVEVACREILIRRNGGSDSLQGRMGPFLLVTGAKMIFSKNPVTEAAVRASLGEVVYDGTSVKNAVIDARVKQVGDRFETLVVTAPGLSLDGSGTASAVKGKFTFDPAAFQSKLGVLLGENRIGGKPLTGTLEVTLAEKSRDVKGSLAGPEFVFKKQSHRDVKIDFDLGMGEAIAIRQARAAASSGWLEARGTYADEGADVKLNGEGDLAQLAGVMTLPEDARVSGKATVTGSVAGKDVLTAALALEVANLAVARGGKSITDPAATIVAELTVDRKAKTISIGKGELNSTFARGTVGGRVLDYDGTAEIQDFALDLRYVPEKFGPVLGLFVPGDLIGAEEQALTLKISGRATAAELKGVLGMKLDAYRYQGIQVSGPVDGTLEGGILSLKAPLQETAGGVIEGIANVDLREAKDNPESVFTLAAANVAINEETSKMLERLHPIFHLIEGSGRLTGTAEWDASLVWKGPLEAGRDAVATATRSLTGDGKLMVKDFTVQGSLFLGTLLQYLGDGTPGQPGEVSVPKWVIQPNSGRVAYDDCRVFVNGLDMKFRGFVYFDQKLDMEMDVPITQKLAAKNPGLERFLGKNLTVPVKGTVASPSIDFAGAIANVVKKGLLDQLPGPFRDLFGGGKDEKK